MMNCAVCSVEVARSCTGCRTVAYCSIEHQKQDWPVHKSSCSAFKIVDDRSGVKSAMSIRAIGPDEIILSNELPVFQIPPPTCCGVIGIRDQLHLHCISCGVKFGINPWKRCRRCGWPVCGKECEEAPIHAENECEFFRGTDEKFPEEFVCSRTPNCLINRIIKARMTQMRKNRPEDWAIVQEFMEANKLMEFAPLPPGLAGVWNSAMTTVLEVATLRELTKKKCGFAQAERILPGANLQYGRSMFTDFLPPSFDIVIKQRPAEMSGLYKIGSLFKQSETPNCGWELGSDMKLQIKSSVPIKKGTTLTVKRS